MQSDFVANERIGKNCSRREFLQYSGGVLATGAIGSALAGETSPSNSAAVRPGQPPLIWGNLLHLSINMWCDRHVKERSPLLDAGTYQPYLRFNGTLWEELTKRMADAGMNLVVIDLGDGVQYESHPEIAVKNAWPVERLRKELARLRKLGLEPIPKLNFSATHDAWLGVYSRQVSTPPYYKVCEDLIAEVIRLFEMPRFFHLGYDEETAQHQSEYAYVVVRQHELWWHDFKFFVDQVERDGVRPWIWSDYGWHHPQEFLSQMPKSVLQSNWYYGDKFPDAEGYVKWFDELERHGYDQLPTGSNWSTPRNFGLLVEYCRKKIAPLRLKGFLQTPWLPTLPEFRQKHIEAIDQVAAAKAVLARQARQGVDPKVA